MNSDEDMVRYGHIKAWSTELGIPEDVLKDRLKDCKSIPARTHDGKLMYGYSEDDVRRVCADLLGPDGGMT